VVVSVSTAPPVTGIEDALNVPFNPATEETPSKLSATFPEMPPRPNVPILTVAFPAEIVAPE
jgi:hypothetical protein